MKTLLLVLSLLIAPLTRGQTNATTIAVQTNIIVVPAPFIILVTAPGGQALSADIQSVALHYSGSSYSSFGGYRGGYGGGYSGYGSSGSFGTGPSYGLRSSGALTLQSSRGTPAIAPSTAVGPPYGQRQSGATTLLPQNRSFQVAPSSGQGPVVGQRQSGAPILRGNR